MIPTAEEFLGITNSIGHDARIYKGDVIKKLQDFAKLHVQAALKAASEKVKTKYKKKTGVSYSTIGNEMIDKKSILNSYSLNNIR